VIAALFPGQGAEQPRMGLWAAMVDPELLDLASGLVGMDALRVLERGGPPFRRTEVLQPLLVAVCLTVLRRLPLTWEAVAGHSLGEIPAWSAAGGLEAEQAVTLARARGLAMSRQAVRTPGGMAALRRTRPPELTLEMALAAHNAPDTWVVSGVRGKLPPRGKRLPVGGPWHHPVMAGARPAYEEALARCDVRPLSCLFVGNGEGMPIEGPDVPAELSAQLTRPVQWVSTLRYLAENGVRDVVLVGPGHHVASWVRASAPELRIHRTDTRRDLDHTLEALT